MKLGVVTIRLPAPLKAGDAARIRLRLATATKRLQVEEEAFALAQARIRRRRKELQAEIDERAASLVVTVPGFIRRHPSIPGRVQVVRDDTGEVVVERAAEPAELQDVFPGAEPRLPDVYVGVEV